MSMMSMTTVPIKNNQNKMRKIIVSACLLGNNCKYNGKNNANQEVIALKKCYDVIPVCPECFGNLLIPRLPSERVADGSVISKNGENVTSAFIKGAEKTLNIAKENGVKLAVLKERSPSCGCRFIYDGSFTGRIISGSGVTAELLMNNSIKVVSEEQLSELS